MSPGSTKRWPRRIAIAAGCVVVLIALLMIPEGAREVPSSPGKQPFTWDAAAMFEQLEARFVSGGTCPSEELFTKNRARLESLAAELPPPGDERWQALEDDLFAVAASMRTCPEQLEALIELRRGLRIVAKDASEAWTTEADARDRLYRLLYGSRAAIEEVLLQLPRDKAPALTHGRKVLSATPSTKIEGVTIHSGDLLVSRGGAPTSAFIARGSDYPGNFSHVAIVHVDENTGEPSVIEAHIERGVAIANADQYFADKKLRILVLRPRPNLAQMMTDPMLPHEAASRALREAKQRHIPYDFAMDISSSDEQFCSEVASAAYGALGIELWENLSTFSSPGLARWMAGFGVEHLETHGPSDLEYDPKLLVVAEWHDPETLFADHVDNAVIDVMLEQAESGAELGHNAWLLPVARVLKGYSMVLNAFGGEGPVPEGMSATVALRAQWLADRHGKLKQATLAKADAFKTEHGYVPPYWDLVALAREAAQN